MVGVCGDEFLNQLQAKVFFLFTQKLPIITIYLCPIVFPKLKKNIPSK